MVHKVCQATAQDEEHVTAFQEFDATLPEKDILNWTVMVCTWEQDSKHAINPFEVTTSKITENAVHLELALEDEARLYKDLTLDMHSNAHDDIPPSCLIAQGLELEDH
ncbi:hypothetical protein H2248_002958 [Termitomyces sp. 'cryptogamus']|nr:hypothetical protein H2248_002958 [Termitomyces sp. 'cryptogamus']